jgi:NitT/TauT family transport system substrate-binding protein
VDLIKADFGKYAHHIVKITKGRLRPEELGQQFIHYVPAENYELEKFDSAYEWMESWKLTAGKNSHATLVAS